MKMPLGPFKRCSKCGYKFQKTAKFFRRHRGKKDGLSSRCKICLAEADQEKKASETPEQRENRIAKARKANKTPRARNREKYLEQQRRWRAQNIERMRQLRRRSEQRLYRESPIHKVKKMAKKAMRACVTGKKSQTWEQLVGYSFDALRQHLERQFTKDMTWDNHGRGGWHIDHIVPISAFRIERPGDAEFRACWALTNLRPLMQAENLSKHSKRTHLI